MVGCFWPVFFFADHNRKVLASFHQHLMAEAPQAAQANFELASLRNIERSATEETKIIRQRVKYKGGES